LTNASPRYQVEMRNHVITQEMIDFIDEEYETSDPYFWDKVYKNVLDLISDFVEGKTLTQEESDFVKWVYDDLVESSSSD
jgi:hypothetical protein